MYKNTLFVSVKGKSMTTNQVKTSKFDIFVKLSLIFFISLLSFAVGTWVGKRYTEQQFKLAQLEPSSNKNHEAAHNEEHNAHTEESTVADTKEAPMTDDEIAKLAEQFVNNETTTEVEEAIEKETSARGIASADNHKDTKAVTNEAPKREVHLKKEEATDQRNVAAVAKNVLQNNTTKFTVQVSAYAKESDAEAKVTELKSKGYAAYFVTATVNNQQWYRVNVGLFATQKEATEMKANLIAKAAIESAIIQKVSAE